MLFQNLPRVYISKNVIFRKTCLAMCHHFRHRHMFNSMMISHTGIRTWFTILVGHCSPERRRRNLFCMVLLMSVYSKFHRGMAENEDIEYGKVIIETANKSKLIFCKGASNLRLYNRYKKSLVKFFNNLLKIFLINQRSIYHLWWCYIEFSIPISLHPCGLECLKNVSKLAVGVHGIRDIVFSS